MLKRVIFDTNIYGKIIENRELREMINAAEGEIRVYGCRVINNELRGYHGTLKIEFEGDGFRITDIQKLYSTHLRAAEHLLDLYDDESMSERRARAWIRNMCRPNEKVQEAVEFVKSRAEG